MNGAIAVTLINNGSTAAPAYYVAVAGFLGDGIQIYNARDTGDAGGHFSLAGNMSNVNPGYQATISVEERFWMV